MQSQSRVPFRGRLRAWSIQNEKRLIALNICSLVILLFAYLFTLMIQVYSEELRSLMHAIMLVSASLIVLSLASKGPIPVLISIVGIVLIYNAVISPLYATLESQMIIGRPSVISTNPEQSLQVDRPMHFLLGVSMIVFATIIAHRPSMLFTRNRPPPVEEEWSTYPLWQDNSVLADGHTEHVVPVRDLMTPQDLHLLWRYDYVMANIYGTHHLVKPDGLVPKDSTVLLRDKTGGRILGKPKFTGFFI